MQTHNHICTHMHTYTRAPLRRAPHTDLSFWSPRTLRSAARLCRHSSTFIHTHTHAPVRRAPHTDPSSRSPRTSRSASRPSKHKHTHLHTYTHAYTCASLRRAPHSDPSSWSPRTSSSASGKGPVMVLNPGLAPFLAEGPPNRREARASISGAVAAVCAASSGTRSTTHVSVLLL